ncbi:hypothetical protein V1514DRAFT_325305 [Lipomyces japonicus]|uniref:uncharacterized protein n=1 Tax=Lipomyces japonicus TaxID=56871 RepID=UPI0034CE7E48
MGFKSYTLVFKQSNILITFFLHVIHIVACTVVLGIAGRDLHLHSYASTAGWVYIITVASLSLVLVLWHMVKITTYTIQDYFAVNIVLSAFWLACVAVILHYLFLPLPCTVTTTTTIPATSTSFEQQDADLDQVIQWLVHAECKRDIVLFSFIMASFILWLSTAVVYGTLVHLHKSSTRIRQFDKEKGIEMVSASEAVGVAAVAAEPGTSPPSNTSYHSLSQQ